MASYLPILLAIVCRLLNHRSYVLFMPKTDGTTVVFYLYNIIRYKMFAFGVETMQKIVNPNCCIHKRNIIFKLYSCVNFISVLLYVTYQVCCMHLIVALE